MKHYIKVNLPESEEDYLAGYGEGMWAKVDDKTLEAYNSDAVGEGFEAILDNDSFYWDGLEHGQIAPIEMRGDKRPVVPYNWLFAIFGKC